MFAPGIEKHVKVVLGANTGAFNSSMMAATASINKLKVAVVAANAAVVAFSVVLAVKGVKAAADFEQGMARVRAVTGAAGKDFKALTDKAKQLGRDTKFTMVEIAAGMESLGRAGFKTNELVDAMGGVSALAASQMMELSEAGEITANILRQLQMPAREADRVVNVLAATAASSNTTVASLGDSFVEIAPVLGSLGTEVEELAGLIGKLGDVGYKGSKATTTLRTALTRLADPPKEASDAMAELGLSLFDERGKFIGMTNLIAELEVKYRDLTDEQRLAYTGMIFGARVVPQLNALINVGADSIREYTESITGTNAAFEQMETMQDTLSGQMVILSSSWTLLLQTLGEPVLGVLKDIVMWMTRMINRAILWAESIRDKVAAAFRTMYEYVKANREGLGFLVKQFLNMAKIVGIIVGVAAAFKLLTSPIIWLTAAAFVLYAAWQSNLFKIQQAVEKVGQALVGVFTAPIKFLFSVTGHEQAAEALGDFTSNLSSGVEKVIGAIGGFFLGKWLLGGLLGHVARASLAGGVLSLGALLVAGTLVWDIGAKLKLDTKELISLGGDLPASLEAAKKRIALTIGKIAVDVLLVFGTVALAKGFMAGLAAKIAALGVGFTAGIMPTIGVGLVLAATIGLQAVLSSQESTISGTKFSTADFALKISAALAGFGITFAVTKNVWLAVIAANLAFRFTPQFELLSEGIKEKLLSALEGAVLVMAGAMGGFVAAGPAGALLGAIGGLTLKLLIDLLPSFHLGSTKEDIQNDLESTTAFISPPPLEYEVPIVPLWLPSEENVSAVEKVADEAERLNDALQSMPGVTDIEPKFGWLYDVEQSFRDLRNTVDDLGVSLSGLSVSGLSVPEFPSFEPQYGKQLGGLVPGEGLGDKIPALLEPGEFVIPNWMMQIDWVANLVKGIWSSGRRMAVGGPAIGTTSAPASAGTFDKIIESIRSILESVYETMRPYAENKAWLDEAFAAIDGLIGSLGDLDETYQGLLQSMQEQEEEIRKAVEETNKQADAARDNADATNESQDAIRTLEEALAELTIAMSAEDIYSTLKSLATEFPDSIVAIVTRGKDLVQSMLAQAEGLRALADGNATMIAAAVGLEAEADKLANALGILGDTVADTSLQKALEQLTIAMSAEGIYAGLRALATEFPDGIDQIVARGRELVQGMITRANSLRALAGENEEMIASAIRLEGEADFLAVFLNIAGDAANSFADRINALDLSGLTAGIEQVLSEATAAAEEAGTLGDFMGAISDIDAVLRTLDTGKLEQIFGEGSTFPAVIQEKAKTYWEQMAGMGYEYGETMAQTAARVEREAAEAAREQERAAAEAKRAAEEAAREAEQAAREAAQAAQEAFRDMFTEPAMEALSSGNWMQAAEAIQTFAQTRGDLMATAASLSQANDVVIEETEVLQLIVGGQRTLLSTMDDLISVMRIAGEDVTALEDMKESIELLLDPLARMRYELIAGIVEGTGKDFRQQMLDLLLSEGATAGVKDRIEEALGMGDIEGVHDMLESLGEAESVVESWTQDMEKLGFLEEAEKLRSAMQVFYADLKGVSPVLVALHENLEEYGEKAKDVLGYFLPSAVQEAVSATIDFGTVVTDTATVSFPMLNKAINLLKEGNVKAATSAFITGGALDLLSAALSLIQAIINAFVGDLEKRKEELEDALAFYISAFEKAASVINTVFSSFGTLGDLMSITLNAFVSSLQMLTLEGFDLLNAGISMLANYLSSLINTIMGLIQKSDAYQAVQEQGSRAWKAIANLFGQFLWPLAALLKHILDWLGVQEEVNNEMERAVEIGVPSAWKRELRAYEAAAPGQVYTEPTGGGIEIPAWATAVVEGIATAIEGLLTKYGISDWASLLESFKQGSIKFWNYVSDKVPELVGSLDSIFSTISDAIGGGVVDTIVDWLTRGFDWLINVAPDIVASGVEFIKMVWGLIGDVWEWLNKQDWEQIWKNIESQFSTFLTALENLDRFDDVIQELGDVTAAIDALKSTMKWVVGIAAGAIVGGIGGALMPLTFGTSLVGATLGALTGAMIGAGIVAMFDKGGIVPGPIGEPLLGMVHGGETVIPYGQNAQPIQVYVEEHVYLGQDEVSDLVIDKIQHKSRLMTGSRSTVAALTRRG